MPATRYSDAQLRAAVASSKTTRETVEKLGLRVGGRTYKLVERRMTALAIDTSHFTSARGWRRGQLSRRWTDQQLREAVATTTSYAGAISQLGLIPQGGNYRHIKRCIAELELDTSHFLGQGWNLGLKFRPNLPVPLEQVLVANRPTASHLLKMRLINNGLKPAACEHCGWAQRSTDGRLPLQLDHINGDHDDNRLENLQILCPNCHALQPTHRGANKRLRRK